MKWQRELDECHFESPADFLYYYVMKGCGCGNGPEIAKRAWSIFLEIAEKREDRYKVIYKSMYNQTITQWLDSLELLEHGSSVGGSWLSEDGKALYQALLTKPNSN